MFNRCVPASIWYSASLHARRSNSFFLCGALWLCPMKVLFLVWCNSNSLRSIRSSTCINSYWSALGGVRPSDCGYLTSIISRGAQCHESKQMPTVSIETDSSYVLNLSNGFSLIYVFRVLNSPVWLISCVNTRVLSSLFILILCLLIYFLFFLSWISAREALRTCVQILPFPRLQSFPTEQW